MSAGHDKASDKLLDEYLHGESAFSQAYRESADELDAVPPELDRRVLQEARASVTQVSAKRFSWQRYTPMLAIAATAVLTISIVMQSGRESKVLAPQLEAARPEIALEDQAELKKEAREQPVVLMPEIAEIPSIEAQTHAVQPVVPMVDMPVRSADSTSQREEASAQVLAKSVAPTAAEAPAIAVAPAPIDEAVAVAQRAESDRAAKSAGATAPAAPTATTELEEAVVTGTLIRESRPAPTSVNVRTSQRPAERAAQTGEARSAAASAPTLRAREREPEAWLRYIRDLRAAARDDEADREWRRFTERYPNFEVAKDDLARPK